MIILILGEQQPTLGVPDWVPLIGGTELAGPLPEIGIIAAFVVTIPIAILLLGYVFKMSLVDRLLTPGGDDIPLVIATIGLGLVIREYLRVEFGATPQQFPSVFGTEVWRPGGIAISADDVGILVGEHRRDPRRSSCSCGARTPVGRWRPPRRARTRPVCWGSPSAG